MRGHGPSDGRPPRSTSTGADARRARAPAQSASGRSPQWRARRGRHAEAPQGVQEDRRVGLAGAHRRRSPRPRAKRSATPRAGEDVRQAAVPVADDREAHARPRARASSAGQGVGEEREAQAVHQDRARAAPAGARRRRGPRPGRRRTRGAGPRARRASRPRSWWRAVVGDLRAQRGRATRSARMGVARGGQQGPQARHRIGQVEKGSVGVEENCLRRGPGRGGVLHRPVYNPARRAAEGRAQGCADVARIRARFILASALVVILAGAWVPVLVADHYADGPGGADVGYARVDRGWKFVYHAIRLSRDARLGDVRARARPGARRLGRAAPSPTASSSSTPTAPSPCPCPRAAPPPAAGRRVAEPLSRLGWVVRGRVRNGPPQMIGLLDYPTGPRRLEHPPAAARWPRERPPPAAARAPAARPPAPHQPAACILGGILAAMLGGVVLVSALRHPLGGAEPRRGRAQGDPARPEHPDLRQGQEAPRDHRRRDQPHRGAEQPHPPGPQGRDRRDRGQALLRARRRRLLPPRWAPRRRDLESGSATPGRQHDHDAADQEPLRPGRRADALQEDRGGLPRLPVREEVHQGRDPHEVPQRRLLRPERHRRAGRVADLLRQGRLGDQPAAGRPAGRPARRRRRATTRSRNPDEARARRNLCSTRWPTRATSPGSGPTRPCARASASSAARPTSASARSTSSSTSARC